MFNIYSTLCVATLAFGSTPWRSFGLELRMCWYPLGSLATTLEVRWPSCKSPTGGRIIILVSSAKITRVPLAPTARDGRLQKVSRAFDPGTPDNGVCIQSRCFFVLPVDILSGLESEASAGMRDANSRRSFVEQVRAHGVRHTSEAMLYGPDIHTRPGLRLHSQVPIFGSANCVVCEIGPFTRNRSQLARFASLEPDLSRRYHRKSTPGIAVVSLSRLRRGVQPFSMHQAPARATAAFGRAGPASLLCLPCFSGASRCCRRVSAP